jgi:hypothetical protein
LACFLRKEFHVQTSVLIGLEVTPASLAAFLLFGLFMGAVGYFVAKTGRSPKIERKALPIPHHPGFREMTGPGSDQRIHPRYETQPFKLRLTVANSGHELDGLVLNQSLGGLCICVTQNLPEGAVLNLCDAEQAQDRTKSRVVIKHCRPHRGGWALGCQYL